MATPLYRPEFLTPRQVAGLTQLSYHTVVRLLQSGELPATKLAGKWRIRTEDYDAWTTHAQGGQA